MHLFRRHAANAITSGNLLCGCYGIIALLVQHSFVSAMYAVVAAAVLDFLDGFVARLTKTDSRIGAELDSLADVVTFGVLPALILFEMAGGVHSTIPVVGAYPVLLVAVFSAVRLAIFNVSTDQKEEFIGVPTPANALLIATLPILQSSEILPYSFFLPESLLVLSLVLSYLLVSPIHLFALKFKSFAWKGNEVRYIFSVVSLLLLLYWRFFAFPFVIATYIVLSLIIHIQKR
jgi:CDP-diacylglycerol--serine O-phosphatidyltransferase